MGADDGVSPKSLPASMTRFLKKFATARRRLSRRFQQAKHPQNGMLCASSEASRASFNKAREQMTGTSNSSNRKRFEAKSQYCPNKKALVITVFIMFLQSRCAHRKITFCY